MNYFKRGCAIKFKKKKRSEIGSKSDSQLGGFFFFLVLVFSTLRGEIIIIYFL